MSDKFYSIIIWSAIGEQLFRDTVNFITDIHWRPFQFETLTEKDEEDFTKTSKTQIKKYELDDDKIVKKAKYEREQRRALLKE